MNLDVPFAVDLAHRLRQRGLPIPGGIIGDRALADFLIQEAGKPGEKEHAATLDFPAEKPSGSEPIEEEIHIDPAVRVDVYKRQSLPFEFSLKWYEALLENDKLITATLNSLWIAVVTGLVCVVLATMLVLGMQALGVKLRSKINALMLMPLAIPWLILGLSLLLMIRALSMTKGMGFVLMGHIVVSLPYAALVLLARVQSMDPALEEASASLGASPPVTFLRVTMPALAPGMVAGGFLAFMISFDNFVISYFLMPPGVSTLPIEIQASIRFGFTPEINAVSTLIILISLLCICLLYTSLLKNADFMIGNSSAGVRETSIYGIPVSYTHLVCIRDRDYTVKMSRGVIRDGQTIISEGPLKDYGERIRKIDRHKRLALVEAPLGHKIREVKLGLEITEKN